MRDDRKAVTGFVVANKSRFNSENKISRGKERDAVTEVNHNAMLIMKLFQISLIFFCCKSLLAFSSFNFTEVREALRSLKMLYNFVEENKKDLNVDGAFGVAISAALLILAQRDPNISSKISGLKEVLTPLITWGIRLSNITVDPDFMTEDYATLSRVLIDIPSWVSKIGTPRHGDLRNRGAPDLEGVSFVLYETLNMRRTNTPNSQSDKCLAELIAQKCHFSKNCQNQILDNKAYGYPLTHRLIHLLIGVFIGCDMSGYYSVEDRTSRLCAEILMESDLIKRLGIPIPFRDLFIEQAMLCGGIVGFSEFQTPEYRQYPIAWQEKNGCFKEFPDAEKKYWNLILNNLGDEKIRKHDKKWSWSKTESNIYPVDKYFQSALDHNRLGVKPNRATGEELTPKQYYLSLDQLKDEESRYKGKLENTLFTKSDLLTKTKLYAESSGELQRQIRKKRGSQTMGDDGCRSHITGLAAAYIAGNIRYMVYENLKDAH